MIKRDIIIFLMIPALVLTVSFFMGCKAYDEKGYQEELGFTSISMGQTSSISKARQLVIRDEQEFADIWQDIDAARSLPEIDFEEEMVIAVFMGEKPTGGYSIEIDSIYEYPDRIVVNVVETEPDPDDMTTQALTYPYHIVTTANTEREVKFESIE